MPFRPSGGRRGLDTRHGQQDVGPTCDDDTVARVADIVRHDGPDRLADVRGRGRDGRLQGGLDARTSRGLASGTVRRIGRLRTAGGAGRDTNRYAQRAHHDNGYSHTIRGTRPRLASGKQARRHWKCAPSGIRGRLGAHIIVGYHTNG